MAEFLKAFELTTNWEGGYVNDPTDAGRRTYRGVSEANNPSWPGWSIVNKNEPLKRGEFIKDKRLDGMVEVLYYEKYWQKISAEKINNQAIANMLFDWYVTSGYHAAKALQKVVGEVDDGIIGRKTLSAVNGGCQENIFNQFKALRAKFYNDIVVRKESQRKFLAGWLNRTNSFTFE